MKRTVEITSIRVEITDEAEDLQSGGVVFSGRFSELKLPEKCTVDQAIELLQRLKEAARVPDPGEGEAAMITVAGKPFRCECGANVFTKLSGGRFSCNGCSAVYDGS